MANKIKLTPRVFTEDGSVVVTADATVDGKPMPTRYSISVGTNGLASRLVRAIDAGAAFTNAKWMVDVHGEDYVSFDVQVRGRTLSADLRSLGF